jgi:hypothetical protein
MLRILNSDRRFFFFFVDKVVGIVETYKLRDFEFKFE